MFSMNTKQLPLLELLPKTGMEPISLTLPEDGTPLWKYWKEFVYDYLRTGRSEKTIQSTKDSLRMLLCHSPIRFLENFNDSKYISRVFQELKDRRNWSANTHNTHLKNIKTYFIWLLDQEYITENKLDRIRKHRVQIKEQNALTQEQVERVLGNIRTRRQSRLEYCRNMFFIDLLSLTGARPCELLEMTTDDIYFEGGGYKAKIHGKKQKGRIRYYKLPSYLEAALHEYMRYRNLGGRNETNLFISSSRKTGWTYNGLRKLFTAISKEVKFEVTPYSFRRYVATELNRRGLDMNKIADHLGHTRVSTTKLYIARSACLTSEGVDLLANSRCAFQST